MVITIYLNAELFDLNDNALKRITNCVRKQRATLTNQIGKCYSRKACLKLYTNVFFYQIHTFNKNYYITLFYMFTY